MSPKELTDPRIYMAVERALKQVDKGVYRTHTWLYKMYGAIIFLTCLVLTFYVLKVI